MTEHEPVRLPEVLARRVLELTEEAVCVVDGRGEGMPVAWVNPAFERLTGYAAAEVVGKNPRFLQGGDRDQPAIGELKDAIGGGTVVSVTLRNYRADGTMFWHALRLVPVEAEGGAWWIGFSRDVTEERRIAADLGRRGEELEGLRLRLAQVDPVDRGTGLKTARAFRLELERSWFICAREKRSLVVFLFAPDFFDVYGETFGRTASDSGLRMLGRAVSGCFRRASDMVGRTGDMQFGALALDMDEAQAREHARRVFDRARDLAIHNPRSPAGRFMTLSAGIAVGRPGPGGSWEALMASASTALEKCQGEGWEQVGVAEAEAGPGEG